MLVDAVNRHDQDSRGTRSGRVELRFLGHGCVLISAAGQSLLVDPYNPGGFGGRMGYRPVPYSADAVVCSHDHLDHCALADLPNQPRRLRPPAVFGPFEVEAVRAFHDEYQGRRRGGEVDILQVRVAGLRLVHLADVGHSPTAALVDRLRGPDVLLLPVGGFFTIGAAQAFEWCQRLGPRLAVPMHYRTTSCTLPIRGVAGFERYFPCRRRNQTSFVELDSGMLSLGSRMVVLEPECCTDGSTATHGRGGPGVTAPVSAAHEQESDTLDASNASQV